MIYLLSSQPNADAAKIREGYVKAIVKLIVLIVVLFILSAVFAYVFLALLPPIGIRLQPYYGYVNIALTLILGILIVFAFADVIYYSMRMKYAHDIARAFRNVFTMIGIGALITIIAGQVGGGLAGVSVGGFLGIVIGFGTQQVLGQAVAGLFLLVTRPFKINDYVTIQGDTGTVEDVGILFSVIIKDDGTKVLIPSNIIIGNKIYLPPKPQKTS
ncbi:MAG: mechanosensitive ion channel [Nitrososphaerota archaeon]|nr:mechanosensitive ion channel [Nitrososphaerota archaeon]